MFVYDLVVVLDKAPAGIDDLDKTMNTQRDDIIVEFEKVVKIAKNLQKQEMEKVLQQKKGDMSANFEKRAHIGTNVHKEELDSLKL